MVHCSPAYEYFWVEQKMERVTDRCLVPRQLSCRCYGRPSWSRASSAARQSLSRLDSSGTVLFYAFLVQLSVSSHFRSLSGPCVLPAAVIICPVLMCWGTGAHYHLPLVYFSLYARLSCHQFVFVSWFLISRDCFGPLCLGLALANSLPDLFGFPVYRHVFWQVKLEEEPSTVLSCAQFPSRTPSNPHLWL